MHSKWIHLQKADVKVRSSGQGDPKSIFCRKGKQFDLVGLELTFHVRVNTI